MQRIFRCWECNYEKVGHRPSSPQAEVNPAVGQSITHEAFWGEQTLFWASPGAAALYCQLWNSVKATNEESN